MPKKQVVNIELFASDGASPVFKKAAQNANALKQSIEAVSKASALKGNWLGSVENAAREASAIRPKLVAAQATALRGSFATGLGTVGTGGGSLFDSSYLRTPALGGVKQAQAEAAQKAKELAKSISAVEPPARTLSKVFAENRLALVAWGAAVFTAGKMALDAAIMVDRLNKAYTTIEGTSMGARTQLDYMYETSHKLGLQFFETAEASKNFFAAMKGTSIEKDANRIWESVATAATALSLSSGDVESIFRSLGQMISKGKVQAEELRGQLGERLPGAFQLAAKAMGVTTVELDKMLERGEVLAEELLPKLGDEIRNTFGHGAQQAVDGLQQNMNRLSTEWERFKASILDSGGVAKVLRGISDSMKGYNDAEEARARRLEVIEQMRAARIVPMGKVTVSGDVRRSGRSSGAVYSQAYTNEQIEAFIKSREAVRDFNKEVKASNDAIEKTLRDSSAVVESFISKTYEYESRALNDRYQKVVKAIDDRIALYQKEGVDYSKELEKRALADKVYAEQLAALKRKHDRKDPDKLAAKQAERDKRKAEKEYKQETRDLDMVADVMQELAQKTGQYGLAVSAVNELIDRQGELWLKAGVPPQYVEQLKEIRELEASREGWAGAMLATQEYYTEATNMAEAYKGVVTSAFGGMEDAIVNACMTGKLSFSDMVNSMIADLMRLMVRQSITGPLASALGQGIAGLFAPSTANSVLGGPTPAGTDVVVGLGWHAGGLVGKDNPTFLRTVPSSLFAGAPRFHGGTGYVKPGEYPAILKAGERVLNPAETRAYQSGREPVVNVNIVNSTGQQATTRTRSDNHGNKTIDVYVGDMAAKQMATPGTSLNRAVSAQTGTRRPAIRR